MSKPRLINRDEQKPANFSAAQFTLGLLFIICMAGAAYISIAFFWAKFSRAEVFFAECSREMLNANNFITPLYHQHAFFDKPIFVYWLIIGMFKLLGTTHFAARLPSIIASLITIVSTALAGRALYGRAPGLLSSFMLSSAFMYLSFSTLCMSDIFLVLFDVLSLIAVYAGIKIAEKRSLIWWLASVSMGFAFLTKGPVGLVLPVTASLIYLALTKNLGLIKIKHILFALTTIAIIASPWFYAAYLANGSSALIYFFVHENVQRFAGSAYDAHKPFGYIVLGFFLGFAPWSILLPPAFFAFCVELRKKISEGLSTLSPRLSGELFLWLWVFVAVEFFCFSHGQCDYYTLPAYPAAALLAAGYFDSQLQRFSASSQKRILWITGVITCGIFIATICFASSILPVFNTLEPVDKIAKLIKKGPNDLRIGTDMTFAAWNDEILFQSGKDPQPLSNLNEIQKFCAQNSPALLVMPLDKYKQLSLNDTKSWRIIAGYKVATHSLTPGYIISRKGHIADPIPLIVATNNETQTYTSQSTIP